MEDADNVTVIQLARLTLRTITNHAEMLSRTIDEIEKRIENHSR